MEINRYEEIIKGILITYVMKWYKTTWALQKYFNIASLVLTHNHNGFPLCYIVVNSNNRSILYSNDFRYYSLLNGELQDGFVDIIDNFASLYNLYSKIDNDRLRITIDITDM